MIKILVGILLGAGSVIGWTIYQFNKMISNYDHYYGEDFMNILNVRIVNEGKLFGWGSDKDNIANFDFVYIDSYLYEG